MDHLALVFGAQPAGQPPRGAAHEAWDLRRVIVDQATGDDRAVLAGQADRIARLERPVDAGDASRQQGGPALHDGGYRPGVERQGAPRDGRVRQPQQPGRGTQPGRREVRPGLLPRQRLRRAPGGREHGRDARLRRDQCRVDLGGHPPGPHATGSDLACLDAVQVLRGAHLSDLRGTALAGIPVVQAIHVGQQDQRVRPGDVGDERRETVVVAEPDLVGGHRVVLVDDRDHAQFQQSLQGALRVAVMAAPHDVIGGQQHLSGADAMQGEGSRVPGDQQPLPDARRRLLGGEVPGPLAQPQRGQSGRDRTRGHQEHLPAIVHPVRERRDQRGDACLVDGTAVRRQRGRADLDHDPARGRNVLACSHGCLFTSRPGLFWATGPGVGRPCRAGLERGPCWSAAPGPSRRRQRRRHRR